MEEDKIIKILSKQESYEKPEGGVLTANLERLSWELCYMEEGKEGEELEFDVIELHSGRRMIKTRSCWLPVKALGEISKFCETLK